MSQSMDKPQTAVASLLHRFPTANLLPNRAVIHRLDRISAAAGCNLFILRDDLTGFGLGGNKTRKLDHLLGDALQKGIDTLVTQKASSFSRNAAFAAKACGMQLHVVIPGDEAGHNPLSRNLFEKLDARLHHVGNDGDVAACADALVARLRHEGRNVHVLHPGGSDAVGTLGYLDLFDQIVGFTRETGVHFSDMVLAIGSAGTQAGLVIGQSVSGYATTITGITTRLSVEEQHAIIHELVQATGRMLGLSRLEASIVLDDTFVGPGYAIPSEEGTVAARLFAHQEGILLDHAYTAKAASALFRYARKRTFHGDNVLFIHTGGNAGLYY
jgi:1-aminocyclopropane-1-carboxylate deaminase/D-cysteine desulfhydrase-like pyridoxal-dependent ACC family enzyme